MGKLYAAIFFMASLGVFADPLEKHAAEFKTQLETKVMPYWYDTARDVENGGYLLRDDARTGRSAPTEKQLVTQARMIWGFAHAHTRRLSTRERNYLEAAEQGYQFLQSKFFDRTNGGYFFTTDLKGNPR